MKRKGGEERGRKRVDWTGGGAFAAMEALQGKPGSQTQNGA